MNPSPAPTWVVVAVIAVAVLSACTSKPPPEALRAVRTAEIRYDKTQETNRYVGTVQSRHEVNEAFRVGGKVVQRKVDVGQKVREGDVLAVLDDTDYRLAVEAAQQQLAAATTQARQAESDRKRLDALKTDGSVSRVRRREGANRVLTRRPRPPRPKRRKLELARNRLKYTVLRASRSGVVTAVRFEVGQVVAEGQPIVSIANEGEPEIVADVPEDHLAVFKTSRYKAWLASAPEQTFEVALRELSPQAAAQTRTFRARLKPVTPRPLPLGATATLVVERQVGEAPTAAIPASAITQNKGQPAVWVVRRAGTEPLATVDLISVSFTGIATTRCSCRGRRPANSSSPPACKRWRRDFVSPCRGRNRAQPTSRRGQVMKSFNLTEWALNHRAIVLFLILAIAIGGVLGFTKLGQLEDPNFSVPSMTVIVIWPGATAQQIQDELLNRMEKKFEQLDHFEKVKTYARQGYGGMTITVVGGTSHEDQREAWYQARKKFSDIKLELPEGVIGPIFNDEYGDVTGLLYAVKGDGVNLANLSDTAEDIKRRLLKVPMVKKVDIYGKQAKKVYVEFSNERLAALGITPLQIAESLRNQNSVLASGQVDTHGDRVLVRVSGQFNSLDDIRNVPVAAGGRLLKLGDFTTITRGYEDPPTYTVRHNGQQVLMLGITMTNDGNIVDLGKAIEKAVANVQTELPYGVELERVADQPTVVSESIWEFERSLMEALAIVLAVCLLSLGWRTGIVVGLSVPIVLGVVALVMLAMGWNLERVSLGSLIIALGLLVDDGIIAVEMMVVKMEEGWDRLKAAAYSYAATAMPRLTGALITVAAFMPIGFSKSTTGEYAGGIFWIVGTAVLFSWVVSGIITPYLAVNMLPKDFGKHHGGDPYDTPFYRRLRRWIDLAIERRWWVIGITVAALAVAIAGSRFVPQQFFPNSSRPELVVELTLKEGASFAATTEKVKKMEAVLKKDEDVRFYTAYTGAGQPRFYLSLNPELPNPGYAVFIVMTRDMEARERVRSRLMASVDEQFPEVWVRVTRLELGPPVGFPVQFRVVGPDTQVVRSIAREVEAVVASSPKVRDVQLDWNDPVRTLRVDLDQDKARALGLAPADVAFVTQTVMNGATMSHLREHEDLIDIVARAVPSERLDLDTLKNVNLYTREGTVVPLSQVARVRYELEEPVLWRRNRDMAITVRADVKDGEQGVSVTQEIRPMLKDIEAKLPFGYRIDVGGAVEESDKANRALMAVFPVMLVTILTILMLQLQSFSRMFMVFLTAPLGLIGVVAALLIFQAPLGFVAILGVTALCGMIMRNAVILVDQVQAEMAEGRDPWNAVLEAAVHRTRPVALTAAATVLAMIPLTRSVFWGPMAIAIMGGLTVATLLTIFFVPALYAAWFRVERAAAPNPPMPSAAAAPA